VRIVLETERMLLRRFTEADARQLAGNIGSWRVLEKCGMRPSGRSTTRMLT
jgi:RimJ/RimL family protein N-acetyltransferase